MAQFKKIGVLTSGGDAPGMNAAVCAVANSAAAKGIQTIGLIGGYKGLIENNLIDLTPYNPAEIIRHGGTALYTDRCLEFKTPEGMAKAIETCKKNDIDAIVAIGGDGTFRGATDLSSRGIPTIGIPGTIDNDITATDYTIGFDTAMNTTVSLIDNLADTCESHARCNVIEVMGRNCGEITLKAGIACGAVATVIPEVPFDEAAAIENMKSLKAEGRRGMIVTISEGVFNPDGSKYGETLAKRIEEATGIETKFCRPGHIFRGGAPHLRDRYTASIMGNTAIDLLINGQSDLIIAERDGKIVPVNIHWALVADRMYKNKLKDGDLDGFTEAEVTAMKELCEKRRQEIKKLYDIGVALSRARHFDN